MTTLDALAVLLVDEDSGRRASVREVIAAPGLRLIDASTPDEGLAEFLQVRPQIVLVGLEPAEAGVEFLQRILAVDPGVDVILLAKGYSAEAAVEAIQQGACDYLAQPLDVERLR